MQQTKSNLFNPRSFYFFSALLLICIGYLIFEFYFIPHEILTADEFVFARHIYDYTLHVPYRDFAPYKTVLGYYLLSIPMYFSHSVLAPLFYIKEEIAILNVIAIIICSYAACQIFDKKAALLTLLAILANHHYLIYSSELRVDMLTSWFCLFAALALLQNRINLGGILLAIAFLISQKAIWYFVAINGGMLLCWISCKTNTYSLRAIVQFNIAAFLVIACYLIGWSLISTPNIVLHNLFYEGYIQANITWYEPIYIRCWLVILAEGPLLFLLWPLTFIRLSEKSTEPNDIKQHMFVFGFSILALIQLIHYKQAFPYNFVFTIPAFFLLYADFITWLINQKNAGAAILPASKIVRWLVILYAIALFYMITALALPIPYTLIGLLPLLLYQFLFSNSGRFKKIAALFMLAIFLFAGILYPLIKTIQGSDALNGDYQQTMIMMLDKLTDANSNYMSGIPFLYQKDQPINGAKNLIGPQIAYLFNPEIGTKPLLLPSIYLAPRTSKQLIADFENSSVKVILYSYRILLLPTEIKNYLADHYQHFYGSLYLYAPVIHAKDTAFKLKFTAHYRIQAAKKLKIMIDGKTYLAGQSISLQKGIHHTKATANYRLALITTAKISTVPTHYQRDSCYAMTKAILT